MKKQIYTTKEVANIFKIRNDDVLAIARTVLKKTDGIGRLGNYYFYTQKDIDKIRSLLGPDETNINS